MKSLSPAEKDVWEIFRHEVSPLASPAEREMGSPHLTACRQVVRGTNLTIAQNWAMIVEEKQ